LILAVREGRLVVSAGLRAEEEGEYLEALTPREVFARCLELRRIPEEQRPELIAAHETILAEISSDDPLAG
ncbi:MAG: hypothetical protein H7834_14425, partial [Magnetococcus sp. YQC-9]